MQKDKRSFIKQNGFMVMVNNLPPVSLILLWTCHKK